MKNAEKIVLLGMNLSQLTDFCQNWQLERRLGKQLFQHIYQHRASSFAHMTDLSLSLRQRLQEECCLGWLQPSRVWRAQDGTHKYLFPTQPLPIEAVVIPNQYGASTLCVSSQVGCRWGCRFCHTGDMGFLRHLSAAEILNQVRCLQQWHQIDRIVFMGMGEPLDNPATMHALPLLSQGMGFGARRITVSTVGILPQFDSFFNLPVPYRLALSVHNPFSEERAQLIPAETVYPLEEVYETLERYRSQRRLTLEYTLVQGYNDQEAHADELARQATRVGARVNLIQCHPHQAGGYYPVSSNSMHRFQNRIKSAGVVCTIRQSRGLDINAACGTLITEAKGAAS